MGCLGNVIWFLCGGLWQGLAWTISGIFWCITIIGIPIGRQCFKFTALTFFPFGKEIRVYLASLFLRMQKRLVFVCSK